MRIYVLMCTYGDDEVSSDFIEYASANLNKVKRMKKVLERFNGLPDDWRSSDYYITHIDLDSLARIGHLERDFIGRIGKPRSPIFKEVNV
jgi:hypothetical protein